MLSLSEWVWFMLQREMLRYHINALTHQTVSVRMAGRSGDHTLSSADITSSLENDESVSEFSDESEESKPDFTGNKSDSDNGTADDSNGDEIRDAGCMTQKQITSLDWVWQTVDESYTTNKIPFTGLSGSKKSTSTQTDSFLIDMIVEETNKYANQKIQLTTWKPQSHVKSWTPINNDEIQMYLGIIMLMGIIKKPNLKSYFSKNPILDTPIFGRTMTQDRFELITKCFHFANNAT
jgi:cytoskeletal protein RodZ